MSAMQFIDRRVRACGRWRARLAATLVALLALSIAGCGSFVRLSYNNADWAVRYLANDYLDLSGEQNELLRDRVQRYHAWHRHGELPRYAELLDELGRRVRVGLTRDDVVWASEALRARYRMLLARAIDDIAPIFDRLTPENLAALERRLAESNDKFRREYEIGHVGRHREERLKVLAKRYREWLGELSAEQEARLARHVAESPDLFAELLEERKRRHAAVLATLREVVPAQGSAAARSTARACLDSVTPTTTTALVALPCEGVRTGSADAGTIAPARSRQAAERLKGLLVTYERHRAPGYERTAADWEARSLQLFLDIERSLNDRQRAHLLERLAHYAGEFRALAAR